jgi:flagellin
LSIKSGQPPSADLLKYLDTFQGAVSSTITWTESSLAAIKEQKGFVDNLVDALKGGLGTLVDADVGEKSVELESAKAAQQLTLQGLSVANTQSATVLRLLDF